MKDTVAIVHHKYYGWVRCVIRESPKDEHIRIRPDNDVYSNLGTKVLSRFRFEDVPMEFIESVEPIINQH